MPCLRADFAFFHASCGRGSSFERVNLFRAVRHSRRRTYNWSLSTTVDYPSLLVPARRAQESLSFFYLVFFPLLFVHQLPFPILLWGLASGGCSIGGRCISLPFLGNPFLRGRRRNPFLPLCQLFGVSPKEQSAVSETYSSSSRRCGIQASSGFPSRFLVGTCGC